MNGFLGYLSAVVTCYTCMTWNGTQLASMVDPHQADQSAMAVLADTVVSDASAADIINAISSGDFSSAETLVKAASVATDAVSTVIEQKPDPMVLTALSAILRSIANTNAAASMLGSNPAVIKVKQCGDAMKLTRDAMPWPDGWGIVQDPAKQNYPGALYCLITDGNQYVPMIVMPTA